MVPQFIIEHELLPLAKGKSGVVFTRFTMEVGISPTLNDSALKPKTSLFCNMDGLNIIGATLVIAFVSTAETPSLTSSRVVERIFEPLAAVTVNTAVLVPVVKLLTTTLAPAPLIVGTHVVTGSLKVTVVSVAVAQTKLVTERLCIEA